MCLNFWFCMDVQYVREQASNLRALRSARGHADAWYRVQVLRVQGVLHGYELVQCKSRVRTAASPLASFFFFGLYQGCTFSILIVKVIVIQYQSFVLRLAVGMAVGAT